jgi:hypothetical protein
VEGSGRGLIPEFSWKDWGHTRQTSLRIFLSGPDLNPVSAKYEAEVILDCGFFVILLSPKIIYVISTTNTKASSTVHNLISIFLRSISIYSRMHIRGLPNVPFKTCFPTKTLCAFLVSSTCATCLVHYNYICQYYSSLRISARLGLYILSWLRGFSRDFRRCVKLRHKHSAHPDAALTRDMLGSVLGPDTRYGISVTVLNTSCSAKCLN